MDIARTEEQHMLRDTLHKFFSTENEFDRLRLRLRSEQPDRMQLWPKLAELGVLGIPFPQSLGGFGGEARSIALLMYEVGEALAVEPVLHGTVIAGRLLSEAVTRDADIANMIERLIAGQSVCVLAHGPGEDPYAEPGIVATALDDGGFELNGQLPLLRHADLADNLLVVASHAGEIRIFAVPANRVHIHPTQLVDFSSAAKVTLNQVTVAADQMLEFDRPGREVLHDAVDWGVFGLVAETLGLVCAANLATFRYLAERKQFGVPIGSFQALQHRAADMKIAQEEIRALLELCILAMAHPASMQRSTILSSAKAHADKLARNVGHEAVQMHGGMGVTDELNVSQIARRLIAIRQEMGSIEVHRNRVGTNVSLVELLRLMETPETLAWREEVAAFTNAKLPAEIATKTRQARKIEKHDYVGWQKVLSEHGLFACEWPEAAGGKNWDLLKQLIFTQESIIQGAPMLSPYGVKMVGPVIFGFGDDAQMEQHLPGILSNDIWWCQGYSEPGSGSDLASLKTTAERDGDHYVVNGSKLWTTEAHWADWMHCLVRTDKQVKAQRGISFLLIDMQTPGISVKPVITIDGVHHTNAVFFDNVRVPVANRVGEEGKGWTIAKFLLGHERVSIADTGTKLRLLTQVQAIFDDVSESLPENSRTLLADQLADLRAQLLALCALERHYVNAWNQGAAVGAEASILKIRGSEVLQAIAELGVRLRSLGGLPYCVDELYECKDLPKDASPESTPMMFEYLYSRCWSVFGGTNEIQRNMLARTLIPHG